MKSENTDAQVKAQIITRINNYRDDAIRLGFDYPTDPIENNTVTDLLNFLEEIVDYVAYNRGWDSASEFVVGLHRIK